MSREAFILAALELIDERGVQALTLRSLAQRLGISAMTPYSQFADKAELLTAMVDHAFAPLGPAGLEERPWARDLEERMRAMNAVFERHPGVLELLMLHPETEQLERFRLLLLARLRASGLPERLAGDALRALTAYVVGYAALKRLRRTPSPQRHSADPFEHGLQLLLRALRDEAAES